jgi:hypothetical protein
MRVSSETPGSNLMCITAQAIALSVQADKFGGYGSAHLIRDLCLNADYNLG